MVVTPKQRRLADVKDNGVMAAIMCTRCLHTYADGKIPGYLESGCCFGSKKSLWDLPGEDPGPGGYWRRCYVCTVAGQDCLSLPKALHEDAKQLSSKIQLHFDRAAARPGQVRLENVDAPAPYAAGEQIQALADIKSAAEELHADLMCRYVPLAEHCNLHNGNVLFTQDTESSFSVQARKRDKKTVLAKELAKKRALEAMDDDDGSVDPDTPIKKRSKVGRRLTKAQADAASKAAAEAAREKAAADKAAADAAAAAAATAVTPSRRRANARTKK